MPTIHLLDGPYAGSVIDAAAPPADYVVVAPERDELVPNPITARWIPQDQRARYLALGAALVDFLTAQGIAPGAYAQYLSFYRMMSSPEPGPGYFDALDRFEQTGHL